MHFGAAGMPAVRVVRPVVPRARRWPRATPSSPSPDEPDGQGAAHVPGREQTPCGACARRVASRVAILRPAVPDPPRWRDARGRRAGGCSRCRSAGDGWSAAGEAETPGRWREAGTPCGASSRRSRWAPRGVQAPAASSTTFSPSAGANSSSTSRVWPSGQVSGGVTASVRKPFMQAEQNQRA